MNPWVILGVVLAVGAAGGTGYYKGHAAGKREVQAEWAEEKAAQYAEYAKAQEEARAKEQALQATADKLREEKDAEIKVLNARANRLSDSLRDRKERPTTQAGTVSGPTESCSGASGAQLARGDGEFLARYAADAARNAAALDHCLKQYEAMRPK